MHAAGRLLARTAAVGAAAGALAVLALSVTGRPLDAASALAFALGALVFGFGLTTWAGVVLLGDSLQYVYDEVDATGDWESADFRQAMAVLAAVGGGGMLGSVGATLLLGL